MSIFGYPTLLVVLDLDETLIFTPQTEEEMPARDPDFSFFVYDSFIRPGARELLTALFAEFDVAVWTSAGASYAAQVVNHLFGANANKLQFVWSSDRCTTRYSAERQEHFNIKNLHKLKRKGYSLDRVVVLDDTKEKHIKNYGNLLHIPEWRGDTYDCALHYIMPYLRFLSEHKSVRRIDKRGWRTHGA